jgi:hypothetical protein
MQVVTCDRGRRLQLWTIGDQGSIPGIVACGSDSIRIQEVMWSCDGSKAAVVENDQVLVWNTTCNTSSDELDKPI